MFAKQALLQLAGAPVLGSTGPWRGAGPFKDQMMGQQKKITESNSHEQLGLRSAEQSATGQPLSFVMLMGRLNPSTRDTSMGVITRADIQK